MQTEEKVKVTFECTPKERSYIKILAASSNITLGEFLLSCARDHFPKVPNKETIEAMKEIDEEGGVLCDSIQDFWEQMGVTPSNEN
jgi:hypothetical protein